MHFFRRASRKKHHAEQLIRTFFFFCKRITTSCTYRLRGRNGGETMQQIMNKGVKRQWCTVVPHTNRCRRRPFYDNILLYGDQSLYPLY